MNQTQTAAKPIPSRSSIILDFLGSMNLAITSLMIIAIASVIGTVLQQNKPYEDYIAKFGPFWHEFFKFLNLYDVYSAVWFLVLLFFLVLSTTVCIYRNTPVMLRDMNNFRLNSKLKSLRTIDNVQEFELAGNGEKEREYLKQFLQVQGYRVREKQHEDRTVIAGMRGRWNRPGYIFAHVGIIILLIGGVMDSTLDINLRELTGASVVDTTSVFVKDMPKESHLSPNSLLSFRGNINISEGQQANFALLQVREGSLVQYLPFAIELKDFRVEHYESGQPKSFESDLVIHDTDRNHTFEQTIAVNYPLIYRGYTIYQASFADGGSKLKMKVWPFYDHKLRTLDIDSIVRGTRVLDTMSGSLNVEIIDFKKYNVLPAPENDPAKRKFVNHGSSFVFKVRDETGAAREYFNYMSPIEQQGRYMYITGMRTSPAEDYRYVHIPADEQFTLQRFMKFHALLNDAERMQKIAIETVDEVLKNAPDSDQYKGNIIQTMLDLVDRFNFGGFVAIDRHVQNAQVDAAQKAKMGEAYIKVLNTIMQAAYVTILEEEGVDLTEGVNQKQEQFYLDSLEALRLIPLYGSPFYVQLTDFTHVESSGLSVAKLPGTNVFYFGSIMSIIGIFLLLYLSHQRVWAVFYQDESGQQRLLFAGAGNRHVADFKQHFAVLVEKLSSLLGKQAA